MYPLKSEQAVARNRWYIAAFANEITRDLIERTILGLPITFYRTEAGEAVAMYGICPHRYYPLARGHLEGDALVCGYHGFTFAANGKCVRIPAQGTGAGFVQPTYRLEERGPLVWIWLGDDAKCDLDAIPPYEDFGLCQPGWAGCAYNYFHIKSRHQLLIDNLMDLTHAAFIHKQIDIGDALLQKRLEGERRERSYQLRRPSRSPWTGFHELLYTEAARFDGLSDMASVTDFYGPELIRTSGPITSAIDGADEVPAEIGKLWIFHGITPETDNTTHYFGFMTRNFRLDDRELDAVLLKTTVSVRQQDVDALEAVEPRLDESANRQSELLAKADAPSRYVRNLMEAMLNEEAALQPSAMASQP